MFALTDVGLPLLAKHTVYVKIHLQESTVTPLSPATVSWKRTGLTFLCLCRISGLFILGRVIVTEYV